MKLFSVLLEKFSVTYHIQTNWVRQYIKYDTNYENDFTLHYIVQCASLMSTGNKI